MEVWGNSIRIVRGEPDRTGDILRLLQEAANWMERNGIKQWTPANLTRMISQAISRIGMFILRLKMKQ